MLKNCCNLAVELQLTSKVPMKKHDFVNIQTLSEDTLLYLIRMAREFEKNPNRELLKGKVVATLFYEPSTRTRPKL